MVFRAALSTLHADLSTIPTSKKVLGMSVCLEALDSPEAITGKMCPEGWTLYKFPGPQFKGVTDKGSAQHAYYIWVDRLNTLGPGPNVPVASTSGRRGHTAIVGGKFVTLHIPYSLGFLSRTLTAASTMRTPAGRARASGPRAAAGRRSTTRAAPRTRRSSTRCRFVPTRSSTEPVFAVLK